MFEHRFVSGHVAGSCQLAVGEKSAVLIDCSQPFCFEETLENIRKGLDGRRLERIILSHSHYDHIAALPQLCEAFPGVPVYAHPYVSGVFRRRGALETMEQLCYTASRLFGEGFCRLEPRVNDFPEPLPLGDGDSFPFDGGELKIIFTPGHTRDSLSVDFPEKGFFCLGETLGVKRPDGRIHPCFLSGYQDALDSVAKAAARGKRQYILSHMAEPLEPGENERFIELSSGAMTESAGLICRLFDSGITGEDLFEKYTERYWSEGYRHIWPFHAYEINSRAAINAVLKELRGQPPASLK